MTVSGQCLCGAVRFRITAAPITTRICWCRVCQRIGAGSATVNVCFPSQAVSVEGELKDYVSTADSGARMHRRFCPQCGTHLFSDAEPRPHLTYVRAGALEDPEVARPEVTIWTSQAPSWACIAEDMPSMERQAPPAG